MSVLCLVASLAAAPDLGAELRQLQATASGTTAFSVVESLTTEVGARLAGTPAEARARTWAVQTLKSLDFENVRVETSTIPGWVRGVERARVTHPYPQSLSVTALGKSVPTEAGGFEAELVRFESLAALEGASEAALKGKIAFIDQAMPKTQDGASYGAVVGIRARGPSVAATKGARAVLIRSVGTDHHRFPHTGALSYDPAAPRIPAAALSVPDAEQLGRILDKGAPVRVHLELGSEEVGPAETGNVIGEIVGSEHPEEIILLGAHLDSWDLGTGAIDDGAGVGIVTGAAKLIMDSAPRRPKRTIRVVLFGAEEVGLLGAKAYAKTHEGELSKHVATMESDFGAGPIYQLDGRVAEAAWPMLQSLQANHLSRLRIIPGANGHAGGPDLYPLRAYEVPIIGLKQDGRDYFDLHHTADDTLDKIDPHSLAQNVAAYASVAWWVAETGPLLRAGPEPSAPSIGAEKSAPDASAPK